jgi:hypothetical protein
LNSHATFSISDGDIFDEDILVKIRNSATPSSDFEQVLSPIAKMPVFYMTNTGYWRRKDPTNYAFIEGSASPLQTAKYNMYSGGTWSLQNCTNGYFFAIWLIYTNDIKYPVAAILGQREDSNLIAAINNNTRSALNVTNFFAQEKYFYRKLIFQTSTSFANAPKARLMYVASASEINPANDRYAAICAYNGNAGTGKYLDFYAGQSSDTSPFPIPEISYVRTITLTAVSPATGTVSFYEVSDLATPLFSISLSNSIYTKVNLAYQILTDWKLVAKVSSGSINKPAITLFIQTSL